MVWVAGRVEEPGILRFAQDDRNKLLWRSDCLFYIDRDFGWVEEGVVD